MTTLNDLSQAIKVWGQELGFQQLGITDTELSAHEPHVRAWLQQGFHGSMGYLERNLEERLHPDRLEPGTCRVIAARMDYLPPDTTPIRVLNEPRLGYVSRYALGRDYHKVVRRRLAKLARRIDDAASDLNGHYRAFTDSAPVLEKALAEKAGLGWIGKHSLLLNRDAGSWFFLGEIFTNVPLPVDEPHTGDHCGSCKACMTVCPTGAIVGPKQLDARRCISYLTIELKGSIPEALRPLIGNRVFGCDDCQLFCPWNRYAAATTETEFAPRHRLDRETLLSLFSWSQQTFEERTEGSAIRRISFDQWRRNLAVALGNGPPTDGVIATLSNARATASTLVVEHIDWAIARLSARVGTANAGE
jgi:epoxyqueuosine reductase